MGKFYAVRVGHKPGIYTSWDSAKAQIHKFKGAKYKGFDNRKDAEDFMALESSRPDSYKNMSTQDKKELAKKLKDEADETSKKANHYVLFCDGSNKVNSHNNKMVYGYGYLILDDGEIKYEESKADDKEDIAKLRNIAGELFSVIKGVRKILSLYGGLVHEITIYFDYTGIEDWYTGTWKASSDLAISYVNQMKLMAKNHDIKFNFRHVKGHSDNEYNERVDQLAFKAVTEFINNTGA